MKLRKNEYCPIHRSLFCCGREQTQKERRLRPCRVAFFRSFPAAQAFHDLPRSAHVVSSHVLDDPLSLSTHFALFSQCRLRPAGGTSLGHLIWHTASFCGPYRCQQISPAQSLKQGQCGPCAAAGIRNVRFHHPGSGCGCCRSGQQHDDHH